MKGFFGALRPPSSLLCKMLLNYLLLNVCCVLTDVLLQID